MRRNKSHTTLISACLAGLLGLSIGGFPMLAVAQKKFTPPKVGLPGRREGGGTRGGACMTGQKRLTALMPATNLGLTVSEQPKLFWYLPEMSAKAAPAVTFVLMDEKNDEVYNTTFAVTGKPGVVSLGLPQTATVPPLSVGKRYQWQLALVCNGETQDYVEGWVQRVQPDNKLTSALQKAAPRDRPAIYAAAGIWQETLSTLAELRRANPRDTRLATDWADLLKSVKLDKITREPLVQCCTLTQAKPNNPARPNTP